MPRQHGGDVSPSSSVSEPSGDEAGKHRHSTRAASSGQPTTAITGGLPEREEHLLELLSQAGGEIRNLRKEVDRQQTVIESLKKKQVAPSRVMKPTASSRNQHPAGASSYAQQQLNSEVTTLRDRVKELSLESFLSVEQIAMLRMRVVDLEAQLDKEKEKSLLATRSAQRAPDANVRQAWNSPPQSARASATKRVAGTSSGRPSTTTSPQRRPNETPEEQYSRFNQVMMSRLRRALTPQPTKEQMAEIVDSMVKELVRALAAHGQELRMEKRGACTYICGGKRKVHLTVDSGKLMAKCGGGHVDLLEYIGKNHLCTQMDR